METMHAAARRTLPPVPRLGGEPVASTLMDDRFAPDTATQRFTLDRVPVEQTSGRRRSYRPAAPAPRSTSSSLNVPTDEILHLADEPQGDAAQRFVARLRAAAADFAEAAGATSALVPEAVPPARHRRSRCRVVLRYADGTDTDVTCLGPAGSPSDAPARHGFDRQVRRWLGAGQPRDGAWLIADPESPSGEAVDLTCWPPSS